MAAGEGFEPSHTESESAVLPLHKPAVLPWNSYHYTKKNRLVKGVFKFSQNFFSPENPVPPPHRRRGGSRRPGGTASGKKYPAGRPHCEKALDMERTPRGMLETGQGARPSPSNSPTKGDCP